MNIYELNNILEGEITNLNKINYDNIQTDTRLVNKNSLLFIFNLEHDNAYKYIKNMILTDKELIKTTTKKIKRNEEMKTI